jgi:UDP-N-acetyl-D-mannosaminuronic acid dehydrogenase
MITVSDIRAKKFSLCVVGMGRIGLPLAVSFASRGIQVTGVEKQHQTLDLLKRKEVPFHEVGIKEALSNNLDSGRIAFVADDGFSYQNSQVIIVAIGTPLKDNLMPDLSSVIDIVSHISISASEDSIVVLRSTLIPGTTETRILPQVKKANKRLHIAVCPERIVEGQALKEIAQLPEIVGVEDHRLGEIIRELFLLLGPKEIAITDTKTAEAAKIFTNVYRYVNFALANEFALICEKLKINATEAIELANNSYSRCNLPLPGPAAGPCLRKDGHFLSNSSAINLTRVAWLINESIPQHIIESIENASGSVYGKKVGVLGKAYKANIDDVRDSPAIILIQQLKIKGANVVSYDPYTHNSQSLEDVLESEIVILAVNHSFFDNLTADMLRKSSLVYDAWSQFSNLHLESYGITYLTLGKGIWDIRKLVMAKY